MSDPAYDAVFECHGKMRPITLGQLTGGSAEADGVAVYLCRCGVWRHSYRPEESQLRAIVEQRMPEYLRGTK